MGAERQDRLEKLERLHRLRQEGALSTTEYEAEKRRLLSDAAVTPVATWKRPLVIVSLGIAVAGIAALVAMAEFRDLSPQAEPKKVVAAVPPITTSPPAKIEAVVEKVTPPAPKEPPLGLYVGKYGFDKIEGLTFLKHPYVKGAVRRTSPTMTARVLTSNVVTSPIVRLGGKIVYTGCEPHNCNWHNWAIVIDEKTRLADLCHFEKADPDGAEISNWYRSSGGRDTSMGQCLDIVPQG